MCALNGNKTRAQGNTQRHNAQEKKRIKSKASTK